MFACSLNRFKNSGSTHDLAIHAFEVADLADLVADVSGNDDTPTNPLKMSLQFPLEV